ncbi:type II secretion system protein [Vampirovibrio sp.]|uniref:type II secretion system protein n=1 Tax=Vampirovibrio sp. TaxID=2717857 RepID=UPI003594315E
MSILKSNSGFTLAELLIALAILGVIATFTIPKILSSSANGQNTAIAKEAASMIAGAYSTYTLNNGSATTVGPSALTQYMNYVSAAVATDLADATSGLNLAACSATFACLRLHNGGILQYDTAETFGGSTSTHAIAFNLDPDGTGPLGAITFWQYYNGRFTTGGQALTPTNAGDTMTTTTTDPSYLSTWN